MPTTIRIRPAWALAFALVLGGPARGEEEVEADDPAPAETAEGRGFPWLCFVVSVAGVAGLGAAVIRAKRRAEGDRPHVRGVGEVWYCRACDRDVAGPACPRCAAANPFLTGPDL